MSTRDDAIRQMLAAGMPDFPPGHPIVGAGKITRYGPKKKAWYLLYEFRLRNGQYVVGGSFGSWGEIASTKLDIDWKGIGDEERERHRQERAAAEARESAKRQDRASNASGRAWQQWNEGRSAKPENIETYLDRKQVAHAKGLRYRSDGTVLVPMIRYDVREEQEKTPGYSGPRRLLGLQKISPDGTKLFNKGMATEGASCRLGHAPKAGEMILVTEGLATGLTLCMAIEHKHPVFLAFSANNVPAVVAILRKLNPGSPILVCADDDAYLESSLNSLLRENFRLTELVRPPLTEAKLSGQVKETAGWVDAELIISADWVVDGDGVHGIVGAVSHGARMVPLTRTNAGRTYANKAAAATDNVIVAWPVFADRKLPAEPDVKGRLTDFNDLHQAEGLDVVKRLLQPELDRLRLSEAVRSMVRAEVAKRGGKRKDAGEDKKASRPVREIDWSSLFDRYTLIYPTDTLWDAELREIVKINPIRLHWGDQVIKWWLENPNRRTVNFEDLVFEPGQDVGPNKINLFRGMPVKPSDKGSCTKLLALLQYLCGEHEQDLAPVTEWVLKWLAYPLKNPGGKMRTAIVMHGPEGTGKNLFFGSVREIYGEYGTLITQTELEDRFNGWLSRKLFLIANEVISRQELRHHVGRLKNMVTEETLPIREMFTPIRYESNHANMVFLTNELQALQIMPGDRRYMVIRTPAELDPKFYGEVVDEIAGGGIAALYAHLKALDCGDFGEHTKPLLTAAKEDLIEIGLSSPQFFWRYLHDGLLWPLQYKLCLTTDLYRAYSTFCARTGERNPRPLNKFIHEFKAMNGVSHKIEDVDDAPDADPGAPAPPRRRRQAPIFIMGESGEIAEARKDRKAWRYFVKKNIAEFSGELHEYLQQGERARSGRGRDDD